MENSKLENMLNLALDATPGERARSLNLDVGFDGEENTWELIVKYSGSLSRLEEEGIRVTELLNEYAVLVVPESGIGRLAEVPEIEYIEKPKRLFFAGEHYKNRVMPLIRQVLRWRNIPARPAALKSYLKEAKHQKPVIFAAAS